MKCYRNLIADGKRSNSRVIPGGNAEKSAKMEIYSKSVNRGSMETRRKVSSMSLVVWLLGVDIYYHDPISQYLLHNQLKVSSKA